MESNLRAPILSDLQFQISLLRLMRIEGQPDSEAMAELERLQEPFLYRLSRQNPKLSAPRHT